MCQCVFVSSFVRLHACIYVCLHACMFVCVDMCVGICAKMYVCIFQTEQIETLTEIDTHAGHTTTQGLHANLTTGSLGFRV